MGRLSKQESMEGLVPGLAVKKEELDCKARAVSCLYPPQSFLVITLLIYMINGGESVY